MKMIFGPANIAQYTVLLLLKNVY